MGLIFKRQPGDLLFFLSGNSQSMNLKTAFLPGNSVTENEIAFNDTWETLKYRGIYFFLGDTVSDQEIFAANVKSYIGTDTVRFLWIKNPNDPVNEWNANQILIDQGSQSNTGVIAQVSLIDFRNYSLVVGGGCTVQMNTSCNGFIITKTSEINNIWFETDAGVYKIYTKGEDITLLFNTGEEGVFQFALLLCSKSPDNPVSDIDKLDVGCRFFFDNVENPSHQYIQSLRYPILTLQNGPITIDGHLDPVTPLDHDRTYFTLDPSQESKIMSCYRTVIGEPVILTPVSSPRPRLVFSVRPSVHSKTLENSQSQYSTDPFYLTLKGAFKITIGTPSGIKEFPSENNDGTPVHRIMCGASGTEYIGLMSENYVIHFFPDQPAYAPHFTPAKPNPSNNISDNQTLTTLATTSWAYITPAGTEPLPVYYAQPEDSLIYQAEITALLSNQFLEYLEVHACTLPGHINSDTVKGFPMAPYPGVDPDFIDDFRQFELKILNPYRRKRIYHITHNMNSLRDDTQSCTGVTPQGLVSHFNTSLSTWEELTLATFIAKTMPEQLQLQEIDDPLKAAFLSNQVFLVVSDVGKFKKYCKEPFKLTIRDWNFDLSPDTWSSHPGHETIVIIKYANTTIEDLVKTPDAWFWPEAATPSTQEKLLTIIEHAKETVTTNPDFAAFVTAVTSETWNGILFLNCDIPLSELPPQLEGIAAGIDPQKFYAHHVGIGITPTYSDSTGIHQKDTSLFGLIHYNDPGNLSYKNKDYDFKVLSLKVLFKNSDIANFSCLIELMINKLFGENSELQNSHIGNNLILNGVYQKNHDKKGIDSYIFIQKGPNLFKIDSHILDYVKTTKAQFITLLNPKDTSDTVRTKFALWGDIQFKSLPLDVFSFGNEYNEKGEIIKEGQLWFSNLAVDMNFDRNAPQDKVFTFDAGAFACDMAGTTAREDSLFQHFPLKVAGILQASHSVTPGKMGIIPVLSVLDQSDLAYPWYALTFELELGTLGDLAGDSGFVVTLAACWAPSEKEYKTYLGVILPNLKSINSLIPLEGVLNLNIGSIELTMDEKDKIEYMLKFKTIALKLLGFSFPPGQVDLFLFGNPDGSDRETLGWYAAYSKGGKK
jgi:hypothetical protein